MMRSGSIPPKNLDMGLLCIDSSNACGLKRLTGLMGTDSQRKMLMELVRVRGLRELRSFSI